MGRADSSGRRRGGQGSKAKRKAKKIAPEAAAFAASADTDLAHARVSNRRRRKRAKPTTAPVAAATDDASPSREPSAEWFCADCQYYNLEGTCASCGSSRDQVQEQQPSETAEGVGTDAAEISDIWELLIFH